MTDYLWALDREDYHWNSHAVEQCSFPTHQPKALETPPVSAPLSALTRIQALANNSHGGISFAGVVVEAADIASDLHQVTRPSRFIIPHFVDLGNQPGYLGFGFEVRHKLQSGDAAQRR